MNWKQATGICSALEALFGEADSQSEEEKTPPQAPKPSETETVERIKLRRVTSRVKKLMEKRNNGK